METGGAGIGSEAKVNLANLPVRRPILGPKDETAGARTGLILVLVLLLLFATMGVAQGATPSPTANATTQQRKLEDLLDRVSPLPPEYKADLGFAILDQAGVAISANQRRTLLDDIFHSASGSHYPYGVTDASSKMHNGLIAGLIGNSKLDVLDIQARSVERALALSPQFAEGMFEEMKLQEDRASCTDADVEDVSMFYTVAAKIIGDSRIKTVFGEVKPAYLLSLVSNMRIPAEMAPLAELFSSMPLTPEQLGEIEGVYDSALNRITASDRELTAAEESGNLTQAINHLATKLAQAGIYPGRLLAAYRSFLLRSLTSESCSDRSLDRAAMAQNFNALVPSSLASSPDLAPLVAKELEAHSKGTSAVKQGGVVDPQIMTKLYCIAAAEAAGSTQAYRNGQPSTIVPESADVDDVIGYAVAPQGADDECPVCEFEARGALLTALVQLLPPGSQLEKAVYAEEDYLSLNDMQKENPVAWLHLLKKLINASRRMNDQTANALTARANKGTLTPLDTPSAAAPEIRKILRGSTDPIIFTYMLADDLLHPPYVAHEAY